MTRFIILIILLSSGQRMFGQAEKLTKAYLSDIFKASVRQNSKRRIQTNNNPWLACNKDSLFYKSDTVYFYDNENYFHQLNSCCDFIGWTFYKKTAFIQNVLQYCNEPPSVKLTTWKDFYKIKLTDYKGLTHVKVYRQGQLIGIYNALAFETVALSQIGQESNRLTLVRNNQ